MRIDYVPVDEFTSPYLFSLRPSDPIEDAKYLMKTEGIRHIPIIEDEHIVGIVSDRDVDLLPPPPPFTGGGLWEIHYHVFA